jgi:hypothetical protein
MVYLLWLAGTIAGITLSAVAIHFTAVIIGPSDRGFGTAFIAALILYILGHILVGPLIFFFGLFYHMWVGLFVWAIIAVFILRRVYEVELYSALIMWVIYFILNFLYIWVFYGNLVIKIIAAGRAAGGLAPL